MRVYAWPGFGLQYLCLVWGTPVRRYAILLVSSILCACGGGSSGSAGDASADVPDAGAADPATVDSAPEALEADVPAEATIPDAVGDVPGDVDAPEVVDDVPATDPGATDAISEVAPDVATDVPAPQDLAGDVTVYTQFVAVESFPDLLLGTWQNGYGDEWIRFVTPQVGIDQYGLGYLIVPDKRDPANPKTRTFCFDYGISSSEGEGYRLIRDFKMVAIDGVTCENDVEDGLSYTGYYDNDRYTDYVCTDGQRLSFHCLRGENPPPSDPGLADSYELEEGHIDGYGGLYENTDDFYTQVVVNADGTYSSRDFDCGGSGGSEWYEVRLTDLSCPSSGFSGTWTFADGTLDLACATEAEPCVGLSEPVCSCNHSRLRGSYLAMLLKQKGRRFIAAEPAAENFWYRVP